MRIWGTGLEKLLSTKLFFAQHHLVFADMKHLFVLHQLFLLTWNNFLLFLSAPDYWYNKNNLVQHQTHKTVFRATPNFCFGHCLGYYVILICFCCHVATKYNHVSKKQGKTINVSTIAVIHYFLNGHLSEASVIDSRYIKMTELQGFC